MNTLSMRYGSFQGPARIKRARHGMEKDWNKFGDPQKKIWKGHYDKSGWLEHRERKFQIGVDK